jgi:hypothetical protein
LQCLTAMDDHKEFEDEIVQLLVMSVSFGFMLNP